tara:strand:- start:2642 stop:2827 length:186 start_codon:yes stop_codon:yes gene_type:complete
MEETNKATTDISRKEALSKLGNYGKYTALTALGTFIILNSQQAQATSLPGGDSDGGGGPNF